jgi:hypothetical protein
LRHFQQFIFFCYPPVLEEGVAPLELKQSRQPLVLQQGAGASLAEEEPVAYVGEEARFLFFRPQQAL